MLRILGRCNGCHHFFSGGLVETMFFCKIDNLPKLYLHTQQRQCGLVIRTPDSISRGHGSISHSATSWCVLGSSVGSSLFWGALNDRSTYVSVNMSVAT